MDVIAALIYGSGQYLINQISQNIEVFTAAKPRNPELAANLILCVCVFFKFWCCIANQPYACAGHTQRNLSGEWWVAFRQ